MNKYKVKVISQESDILRNHLSEQALIDVQSKGGETILNEVDKEGTIYKMLEITAESKESALIQAQEEGYLNTQWKLESIEAI